MRAKSRSVASFVGVLTVALVLQGCLLLDKLIIDTYLAVHGIPEGTEQELVLIVFPRSYCANTFSPTVNLEAFGQIWQPNPFPTWLYFNFLHLDAGDNVLRTEGAMVGVEPDGRILRQIFSLPGICFDAGHKLRVLLLPLGGNIDQNAQMKFGWKIRVPVENYLATTPLGQNPFIAPPDRAIAWIVENDEIGHRDGPFGIPGRFNPLGRPVVDPSTLEVIHFGEEGDSHVTITADARWGQGPECGDQVIHLHTNRVPFDPPQRDCSTMVRGTVTWTRRGERAVTANLPGLSWMACWSDQNGNGLVR